MSQKYIWHSSAEAGIPTIMSFSPNSKLLAASCIKAENGKLISSIYICDTDSTELPANTAAEAGVVYHLEWLDKSHLLAVYEDKAVVYNTADCSQRYSYRFAETGLAAVDIYNGNTALLFNNASLGSGTLVYLSDTLQEKLHVSWNNEVSGVTCTHNYIYVIQGKRVLCYANDGEAMWQLSCDETPQAVLDAKTLLLFSGSRAQELKAPQNNTSAAEETNSESEESKMENEGSSVNHHESEAKASESEAEPSSSETVSASA